MGVRGGARMELDERRGRLIELGMELFSSSSYDEVSIDDIAAAAGVSKGLLYHYFPSKRGFYVATVRAAAEEVLALAEPDPSLPPIERLRAGLDAHLAYVEEHAVGYTTLLRSGIGYDDEVREIVEATRTAFAERLLEGFSPGGGPAEAQVALRGCIGFIEGAVLFWLEERHLERTALRELLVSVIVSTLDAAATGASPFSAT